jgi:hypothetical protein
LSFDRFIELRSQDIISFFFAEPLDIFEGVFDFSTGMKLHLSFKSSLCGREKSEEYCYSLRKVFVSRSMSESLIGNKFPEINRDITSNFESFLELSIGRLDSYHLYTWEESLGIARLTQGGESSVSSYGEFFTARYCYSESLPYESASCHDRKLIER